MNIDGALEPRRMYLLLEVGGCRRLSEGAVGVSSASDVEALNLHDLDTRLGTCFGGRKTVRDAGLETVMVRRLNLKS